MALFAVLPDVFEVSLPIGQVEFVLREEITDLGFSLFGYFTHYRHIREYFVKGIDDSLVASGLLLCETFFQLFQGQFFVVHAASSSS